MSGSATITLLLRTLNASPWLPTLLPRLAEQRRRPLELLLVDSGSTDGTVEAVREAGSRLAGDGVRLLAIDRNRFSHARSTNLGFREARGEIIVMLSQDALPADATWLERLVAPLEADSAGTLSATFGRQIPRPDAFPLERWQIEADYPAASGAAPGVRHSNVNSATRRSAWEREPFDESLPIAEDKVWAERQIASGRRVDYVPGAVVIHSHDYTIRTAGERCAVEARARFLADRTRESPALLFKAWPRQTLRDLSRLLREGAGGEWPRAAAYRFAQFYGMYRGSRLPPAAD